MRKLSANTIFASLALVLTVATGPLALVVTVGSAMARGDGSGGESGNKAALGFRVAQLRGIDNSDPSRISCRKRRPMQNQCRNR